MSTSIQCSYFESLEGLLFLALLLITNVASFVLSYCIVRGKLNSLQYTRLTEHDGQKQLEPSSSISYLSIIFISALIFNILLIDVPRQNLTAVPGIQLQLPVSQILFVFSFTLGTIIAASYHLRVGKMLVLLGYMFALESIALDQIKRLNGQKWLAAVIILLCTFCVFVGIGNLVIKHLSQSHHRAKDQEEDQGADRGEKNVKGIFITVMVVTVAAGVLAHHLWLCEAGISAIEKPIRGMPAKKDAPTHIRTYNHGLIEQSDSEFVFRVYWALEAVLAGLTLGCHYRNLLKPLESNELESSHAQSEDRKRKYLMIMLGLVVPMTRWLWQNVLRIPN